MNAFVTLSLFATVASAWTPPSFCGGIDCPHFVVLNKTSTWELREYGPTTWVGSSVNGTDLMGAVQKQFQLMFKYISGNNAAKQQIAMTAPVLTTIEAGSGPACTSRFNSSFFISPSVLSAPQPSDSNVFLHTLPKMKVLVGWFGGYATDASISTAMSTLASEATANGLQFGSLSGFAAYDSPFHFWNRHNEVWLFLL